MPAKLHFCDLPTQLSTINMASNCNCRLCCCHLLLLFAVHKSSASAKYLTDTNSEWPGHSAAVMIATFTFIYTPSIA